MLVDIAKINLDSPYPVSWDQNNREYLTFSTARNIEYVISFREDSCLFDGLTVFHLLLESPNRPIQGDRVHDKKVREVLFHVLKDFLSRDNGIVIYICDVSDKLQRQRCRLFNSWAKEADVLFPGQFVIEPIIYPELFYGGIVSNQGNPRFKEYMEIFDRKKQLFDDK